MNDIAKVEKMQVPVPAMSQDLVMLSMFERFATDPTISLDRLKELMAMQKEMQNDRAKAEFMRAMSQAQAEMKAVLVDKDNSQTRSKYASYAALDHAIRPIYSRHGFSVTYDTADCGKEDQIRIIAEVSNSGYTKHHHVDMPCDGKGAKGGDVMTKTHAMKSAVTYGKATLLPMIFNIAVTTNKFDDDDDGNAAGGSRFIETEQVQTIRDKIELTKSNLKIFLDLAGAESLETIRADKYEMLTQKLEAKAQKEAAKATKKDDIL
jgi:hypothetical protein